MRYHLVAHPTIGWAWRKEINIYMCRTKREAYAFCGKYDCTRSFMVVAAHKGNKLPDYFRVYDILEE